MFGLFGGSKILIYVFIATAVIGSIGTTYYVWKRSIQREALMEYNQKQLEQNLKDKEEYIRVQAEIAEKHEAEKKRLAEENEKLNAEISKINDYLDSVEAKKADRPSSVVLRRTIENLRGAR